MKKLLYINYGITKACGVYDLGLRHYNAIAQSKKYEIVYAEVNTIHHYFNLCEQEQPDGIIFNYLQGLSHWVDRRIHQYKCPKYCVPHDMRANDIDSVFRRDDLFDYYIILDCHSKENDKVFKTDRPLKKFNHINIYRNDIPKIGSFGFALTHKNFHLIAREVNKCFDEAEINIHMPHAYYDQENQTGQVIKECLDEITKLGIKLNITRDFLGEDEVINKLHHNDINCLFYDAPRDLGISSSLDFLVSAQKPILITESPMFRSYSDELPKFPSVSLYDVWENWNEYQEKVITTYNDSEYYIIRETEEIFDRTL